MATDNWDLPDFRAPERGEGTDVGKVWINGRLVPAKVARDYGQALIDAADFAEQQGTQRTEISVGYFDDDRSGLTIESDSLGGWRGSFGQAVQRLAEDILSDEGKPFAASAIVFSAEGGSEFWLVRGLLTSVSEGGMNLVFEDGYKVAIDDSLVSFRVDG